MVGKKLARNKACIHLTIACPLTTAKVAIAGKASQSYSVKNARQFGLGVEIFADA